MYKFMYTYIHEHFMLQDELWRACLRVCACDLLIQLCPQAGVAVWQILSLSLYVYLSIYDRQGCEYRVAKTHRMHDLCMSLCAKEPCTFRKRAI